MGSALTDDSFPGAHLLHELKALTGFPARITLGNPATPDRTIKIPGMIRKVSSTGITMDLLLPLTVPQIGASVVLEVMTRSALIQCFSVIQHSENPQCLHLRFPDELHAVQRRRSPRTDVSLSASLSTTGGVQGPVQVSNLSAGGAAVVAREPQPVGSVPVLNLQATGMAPAEARAQVVRCSPAPNGEWTLGLAFTGLTPEQEKRLLQYIDLSGSKS